MLGCGVMGFVVIGYVWEKRGISLRTFFFLSSRRRHTRLTCDWSSDVCSSDLLEPQTEVAPHGEVRVQGVRLEHHRDVARGGVERSEERRVGKECRSRWTAY